MTTTATDPATSQSGVAVVASPAPSTTLLSSLTAPPTTARPVDLRPGLVGGAVSSPVTPAPGGSAGVTVYRRTYGTGRWVSRHITGRIVRAYHREAGLSPAWDSYADDPYPYLPAEVADRLAARPIWLAEEAA